MSETNNGHEECRDAHSKGTHLRVCERGESAFHQNKTRTPDECKTDKHDPGKRWMV